MSAVWRSGEETARRSVDCIRSRQKSQDRQVQTFQLFPNTCQSTSIAGRTGSTIVVVSGEDILLVKLWLKVRDAVHNGDSTTGTTLAFPDLGGAAVAHLERKIRRQPRTWDMSSLQPQSSAKIWKYGTRGWRARHGRLYPGTSLPWWGSCSSSREENTDSSQGPGICPPYSHRVPQRSGNTEQEAGGPGMGQQHTTVSGDSLVSPYTCTHCTVTFFARDTTT